MTQSYGWNLRRLQHSRNIGNNNNFRHTFVPYSEKRGSSDDDVDNMKHDTKPRCQRVSDYNWSDSLRSPEPPLSRMLSEWLSRSAHAVMMTFMSYIKCLFTAYGVNCCTDYSPDRAVFKGAERFTGSIPPRREMLRRKFLAM